MKLKALTINFVFDFRKEKVKYQMGSVLNYGKHNIERLSNNVESVGCYISQLFGDKFKCCRNGKEKGTVHA